MQISHNNDNSTSEWTHLNFARSPAIKKKEFKSNLVSANFVAEPEVPYEIPGILALKYN